MILSYYERPDSPWVRVQYSDGKGGKTIIKTSIRKDDPDKKRKIAKELNRLEAMLLTGKNAMPEDDRANWRWVIPYLSTRYGAKKRTLQIYLAQWKQIYLFLEEFDIESPGMLIRDHAYEYADWRCSQVKQKSGRSPGINTAVGELKLLGMIMDEAVARHLAVENPARKLGIEREDTEIKPEIKDDEYLIITAALLKKPMWMRVSFDIAIDTGLRFRDTQIRAERINWDDRMILIEKPKGGVKRQFSIPIYPPIEALLMAMKKEGRPLLWKEPAGTLTGLEWTKFFREIGLPHLCFHCTRVTFITRGMRAGIPESVMMKMVNHANKLISRIYQRWLSDDVRAFADRIPVRACAGAKE